MKQSCSSYNEAELLIQLKAGNEAAFDQLFRQHSSAVYKAAYLFLRSPVLAEEIVQDVFLKLWLKRAEIDIVKRLDAYLFIMTRNFIFDHIKKLSYETKGLASLSRQEPFADDTEFLVRQHQCQELLKQAIDLLPPQQKQVYQLSKIDGLSHELIAVRMQLSRHTVKKHMALALQTIRRQLGNNLEHISWIILVAEIMRF